MALKVTKLVWPTPKPGKAVSRMAIFLQKSILKRAFPSGGTVGRDVDNNLFKPLSAAYKKAKTGGKARASLGGRKARRVSSRPGFPNQRLTDLTAKALGAIAKSRSSITLGFRDARSKAIAGFLQDRNNFWPTTRAEKEAAIDIARQLWKKSTRRARIEGSTISVDLKLR